MIALIGASHWDVIVRGEFPALGRVSVGDVTHEGPAGGTLNAVSHLRSRRPLLITQCLAKPGPRYAQLLDGVDLEAEEVPSLNGATLVVAPSGERSIFLARRPTPWPQPPARLAGADVIDWHWTAPAHLLPSYAPLMRGRVVACVRSVPALLSHGVRPWAVIDSLQDADAPDEQWLARAGCAWCVMTDGARGGRYWVGGEWHSYRAAPTTVVDASGCGDAFRAGQLAAIDDGLPAAEAMRRAAALGAEAASTPGANRFLSAVATT